MFWLFLWLKIKIAQVLTDDKLESQLWRASLFHILAG